MISNQNNFDKNWNAILNKEKINNNKNLDKYNKLGLNNSVNIKWNDLLDKEINNNYKNIEKYEFTNMLKEDKKNERIKIEKNNLAKQENKSNKSFIPYFISQYFI